MFKSYRKWLANFCTILNFATSHLWKVALSLIQGKRLSCVDALYHPFLEDGRIRYHTFLCSCCHTNMNGTRQFCRELEPAATKKFYPSYEKELISIVTAKGNLYDLQPHLLLIVNLFYCVSGANALCYLSSQHNCTTTFVMWTPTFLHCFSMSALSSTSSFRGECALTHTRSCA